MTNYRDLLEQLSRLETEQINPDTIDIDQLPAIEIARKINTQDVTVAAVVKQALEPIARAAEIFAETLRRGHRVFYIGAGTSGRLGVLDAAECPPTFSTSPDQIVGVISGGYDTLSVAREGVEDDRKAAITDLKKRDLTAEDFVIGIAASRWTPYTLSGLEYAKSLGCKTAFIICNRDDDQENTHDILIELPVGPEAITGSTRMKSGTAQKMTLNIISTTAMVLLGKTYGNLMIDLQANSEKLAARSRKILMELLGVSLDGAHDLLDKAGGSVKRAIIMHWLNCSANEADTKLAEAGGLISKLARKD